MQSDAPTAGVGSSAKAEPTPTTYRYDAFISYSHDPRQSAITAALQQAIQRFAKPFWRRRATSLFRDQTNLSANPDLWGTIVDALRSSKFLILIASPKAAESRWVAKEIEWWLSHRGPDTVIIVLVTGSLLWGGAEFSDVGTTALPPLLRTAFDAEPLWVDLTGLATDPVTEGWQRDARFLDAVATIASRLRDLPKEDLFGEEISRHRQTRLAIRTTITVISTLLILAVAAAVFADRKRREATQRADETAAAFIWSQLDFGSLDNPSTRTSVQALWDLATALDGVRDAFLRQLALDRYQTDTLAAGPASIAHSFGLRPSNGTMQRLVTPLRDALLQTTDPDQLRALAQAIQTLGRKLTPEQAGIVLSPILDAISQANNPRTDDQLEAFPLVVQSLGPKLTPAQAHAALGPVLDAIRPNRLASTIRDLALAVRTLGPTPEQAQAALSQIFKAIRQPNSPGSIRDLAFAVSTLGPTPEQTQAALDQIIKGIRRTSSPGLLSLLAQAVQALSPPADEAALSALGAVLDATRQPTSPGGLQALVHAVEALRPKLTQEQTQAALGPALDALRQSTDGYQIQALAQAVQTLGPTRDQTPVALVHVLDAVRGTTDPYQLQALELAVQALGPTPEQAQDALNPILGTMCQTTDPEGVQPLPSYQIKALGQPIQVLGPLLTPEQTLADLDVVLFAISRATDPDRLQALGQAVQAIGTKLAPDHAQAALGPILGTIRQSTNPDQLGTLNPYQLGALAQAIQTLGPKLTPAQAHAALGPVLDVMPFTDLSSPGTLQALAFAVQALGPTTKQAEAALGPVLTAMRYTTDPEGLQALSQAIQTLGPKLGSERSDSEIELPRLVFAKTDEPKVAEALARAIAMTLPAEPAQPYVAAIVELLKWPTATGPAADALLDALHERVPGAPDKEAGLDAMVEWVAATYPDINLDSPPTFPASANIGGAW